MKKLVLFVFLLSVALMGCSGGGEEDKNKLQASELTDKYQVESKTEEYPNGDLLSTITYPVVKDLVDKRIEEKINGKLGESIERYKQLTSLGEDLGIKETVKIWYEVHLKTKEKLSIKVYVTSEMPEDNYSDTSIDLFNFDLNSGENMDLADLFKKNSKYDKKLNSILKDKFKNLGFQTKKEFGGITENQAFYLKGSSLVILFQSLDYTDDPNQPIEFEIPLEDLKDILKSPPEENKQSNNTIDNYNNIINNETKPFEALFFVEDNIGDVTKDHAATLILSFEEIQKKFLSIYEESLFKDEIQMKLVDTFEYNFDGNRIGEINDKDLVMLLKEIINGGYIITNVEGSFMPVQDYTVLEKYNNYLPEDIRDYIDIMADESRQFKELGTGAIISWSDMEDNVIKVEQYMSKYPNSLKEYEVSKQYMNYLRMYLFGFDSAFDYETNKIDDELLKSYRNFVSNNENSETAKMIEDYVSILEKNDYMMCEEVDSFRKSVTSEVEEE